RDPAGVLRDFRSLGGLSGEEEPPLSRTSAPSWSPEQIEALSFGLDRLRTLDHRALTEGGLPCPLHVLASRDDQVVPPAMTEASFPEKHLARLLWQESGGHVLPLTRPEACARCILDAVMEKEP
ncbi:MAG: alpha/beta hydrolase, partial [Magnetococcales bacterium]|nr:alpha/beta hydrolase [Magnetococcales bacterium]